MTLRQLREETNRVGFHFSGTQEIGKQLKGVSGQRVPCAQ